MVALVALMSALAYGSSDFLAGVAARRVPVLRATTVTYLVATLALAAVTFLLPRTVTPAGLWAGAAAGVFAAVGLLTFYAVLASGPMGVLSPAIAVLQAAVPVAVAVALGERLGATAWAGIGLALAAAALLGSAGEDTVQEVAGRGGPALPVPHGGAEHGEAEHGEAGHGEAGHPEAGHGEAGSATAGTGGTHWSGRVVVLTVVSGLGLGLSVVALDRAPANSGQVPALVDLAVGLVMLAVFEVLARWWMPAARLAVVLDGDAAADRQRGVRLPRAAVGAGLLMGAAQALLMVALQSGNLAVVAALLGTYPLSTVILARFVLGERLGPRTLVGVGAALVAAALLAVG